MHLQARPNRSLGLGTALLHPLQDPGVPRPQRHAGPVLAIASAAQIPIELSRLFLENLQLISFILEFLSSIYDDGIFAALIECIMSQTDSPLHRAYQLSEILGSTVWGLSRTCHELLTSKVVQTRY